MGSRGCGGFRRWGKALEDLICTSICYTYPGSTKITTPGSYKSLEDNIWYKSVECMDQPRIYHEYSPGLDGPGDGTPTASKMGAVSLEDVGGFGDGGRSLRGPGPGRARLGGKELQG